MKTFLAIFLALAVCEAAVTTGQTWRETFRAATTKCAKEFNIDDSVVKDYVKNHKVPETENGKCMLACTMEEVKALVDGKLDVQSVKTNNKHKWDDPAIVAKADEIVDKCNAAIVPGAEGKTKCDYAAAISSCIFKHGKELPAPSHAPKPARR